MGKCKLLITMRVTALLLLLSFTQLSASVTAQKVSIHLKNASVREVFEQIKIQTGVEFMFSNNDVEHVKRKNFQLENVDIRAVMSECLRDTDLEFELTDNVIIVKRTVVQPTSPQKIVLQGKVKDKKGESLPGVTVLIKGTALGTVTDERGDFSVAVPEPQGVVLVFSFVGMKPKEFVYKGEEHISVVLEEDMNEMEEVVVTGIFERPTESFTGSVSTYREKELKMVGSQSVLQSLKTLDPTFHVIENNQYGSDPNRMPDIEIRGKTSVVGLKEQYQTDPNQPLFILDGFEVSLQTISDLNMERVASVTILKDAASTAIYGSRAANGVVVIETKKPEPGRLQVKYTGDVMVAIPDLTDYNMMNAEEKLRFEWESEYYKQSNYDPTNVVAWLNLYNERKALVESGVNTYWLSEPLQTGITHKHHLGIEGGDEAMRYGLGVSYNGTDGVMKNSGRDVLSLNIDLLYRKGKFNFSNKFTLDYLESDNAPESFATYVNTNPYYTKETGMASPWLEYRRVGSSTLKVVNPLYNAGLNYLDGTKSVSIRDNVLLEYRILDELKAKGRISFKKSVEKGEIFTSPFHTNFADKVATERGEYRKTTTDLWGYDGDITFTYGKLFAEKHRLNVVAGWNFSSSKNISDAFVAVGFPDDEVRNPAFSNRYPENNKPKYSESLRRSTSMYMNVGYSYANRYQMDANYRRDGSSVFGTNRRFTDTWSVGVSWNIHNEGFMGNWADLMKLRFSVGNPGNQNFSSYNSFHTYILNTDLQNLFGVGSMVYAFGNPDLKWQKTMDYNLGADIALLNNRIRLNVDIYWKNTDPLVVSVARPSSVGMEDFITNLGAQQTKGVSGVLTFAPVYKLEQGINWTISLNGRHQKSEYRKIGNSLDLLNNSLRDEGLRRYRDGGSYSDLWAVRSGGIDPATGDEIFIKKNGTYTFTYDPADEVVVGNTEAKLEGVIGTNFYYKGLTVSAYFRYRLGADVMNNALYSKVEKISRSNITNNQDKRALYDRWQNPGDHAQFRKLKIKSDKADSYPLTSRFVQRENTISGESFSVGYEFGKKVWLQKVRLNNLSLRLTMNDIFRASTIKAERGIDYPFARNISFTVNMNF